MNFKPKVYQNKHRAITNFSGLCKSCGICIVKCPKKVLSFSDEYLGYYGTPAIKCDIENCISCNICEIYCPDGAIRADKKDVSFKIVKNP